MDKPLVNKKYRLEKFPGKGGWTFASIPEILQDRHAYFGWVRVRGTIDGYEIKKYHLMPSGKGTLFLPVKAEIRKKIGKKEGDWVTVILYPDNTPTEIPEEFLECLSEDEAIHNTFLSYSDSDRKAFIDWIYSAKKDETKIERIAIAMKKLEKGLKCSNKLPGTL